MLGSWITRLATRVRWSRWPLQSAPSIRLTIWLAQHGCVISGPIRTPATAGAVRKLLPRSSGALLYTRPTQTVEFRPSKNHAAPQNARTAHNQQGYQVSTSGDQVVVQLNNVEVLRITLGSNMIIKSQDNLSIEAPNITLKATNAVTVMSGANTSVKSQGQLSVQASSTVSITGSTVNVNGDGLVVT